MPSCGRTRDVDSSSLWQANIWTKRDAGTILKVLDRPHRSLKGEPLKAGASVTLEGVDMEAGLGVLPVSFESAVARLTESGALVASARQGRAPLYTVTARALEMLGGGGASAN